MSHEYVTTHPGPDFRFSWDEITHIDLSLSNIVSVREMGKWKISCKRLIYYNVCVKLTWMYCWVCCYSWCLILLVLFSVVLQCRGIFKHLNIRYLITITNKYLFIWRHGRRCCQVVDFMRWVPRIWSSHWKSMKYLYDSCYGSSFGTAYDM